MELVTLTTKEVERLEVLSQVAAGGLPQHAAAQALGLSVRQLKRLLRGYRQAGAPALISKKRGRRPNNALAPEILAAALDLCRGPYAGFGPTFAAEKLHERDGIHINRETLRQLLAGAGLWKSKRRKHERHLPRERRAQFGELMQADGSPHDWFEGRGPKCSLLLAVDDATGRIGAARFEPAETTDGYFALFHQYFERYGLPHAIYVDRHEIFRVNQQNGNADSRTQVGRALHDLHVELICANSPQAKGRIERLNRTCQDRLIKDMRLHGISTIAQANTFLEHWVEKHNRRFAIPPASSMDAHHPVSPDGLHHVLCRQYERVLTRQFTVQFENGIYALESLDGRALVGGMRITIHQHRDGTIIAAHSKRTLTIRLVHRLVKRTPIIDSKELAAHLDRRIPNPKKAHTPPLTHPWKRPQFLLAQAARGHF